MDLWPVLGICIPFRLSGLAVQSPLASLEEPNESCHPQRSDADAYHGYHSRVELRCVRCWVENKRPPSIDDVIPHAVVYGFIRELRFFSG
jgi:hypothetical protein